MTPLPWEQAICVTRFNVGTFQRSKYPAVSAQNLDEPGDSESQVLQVVSAVDLAMYGGEWKGYRLRLNGARSRPAWEATRNLDS